MKYKQALNLHMHRPFFINVFLNISLPWGGGSMHGFNLKEGGGVHNRDEGELGAKM